LKVVAIIQARMGSTRLPGKVLMDLGDMKTLGWCINACQHALVDEVVVATSRLPGDDAIASFCEGMFIPCHRGSETDVLSRFVGATIASNADVILRITGDCPFVDPEVISGVVRLHKETGAPYVTNVSPRTYPDGLDVQLMTRQTLLIADVEAGRAIDRDGVCTWIERNRSRFPAETLICPIPGMEKERWVLDTKEDLAFCRAIAERWSSHRPPTMFDILEILDREPELRQLNAGHVMNERHFENLAEEPIYERTYQRSQAQFAHAKEIIPLAAQTFSKSHLQYPQPSPLFLSHGDGALVWDIDGNEYVDLVSALLPNVLGYRDPDVDNAVRRQLNSGISFSLATELESNLAKILCRIIPCAEAVRFGKTGTDATTAAVRLARAFTGRDRVLVAGGYHGWQDWSVERNLGVPKAVRDLTIRVPFGDMDCISDRFMGFAAVIVEPESNPAYLAYLRRLCDDTGTVLIFDEIITGFRFALGGAQELFGVTPDLATFGKAMANGMPLSAIVGRKDIMKKFAPPDNIFYSGTFFGETLSLAAGIATIKKLERDNVPRKLAATGRAIETGVNSLIKARGLKDAIRLDGDVAFKRIKFRDDKIAALFRKEMISSGTLIVASHNVSAAHGPNEIKRILKSYDHALGVLRDAIDNDDIDKRLAGASVGPMVRAQ
jgi:glutamate-1-semialdehyde 2,1-aminomutase/spore coat polysaccharide biosynthesis protein SpsF